MSSKNKLRRVLYQQQNGQCYYCYRGLSLEQTGPFGETDTHIDHKLPKSRGGENTLDNLALTCPKCNMIKGVMTVEEFREHIARRIQKWRLELSWLENLSAGLEKLYG